MIKRLMDEPVFHITFLVCMMCLMLGGTIFACDSMETASFSSQERCVNAGKKICPGNRHSDKYADCLTEVRERCLPPLKQQLQ